MAITVPKKISIPVCLLNYSHGKEIYRTKTTRLKNPIIIIL